MKKKSTIIFLLISLFIIAALINTNSIEVIRDKSEYKVIRLTANNEELNSVLYFTNNGFTRDDKELVFVKKINGKWQLMLIDLSTYAIKQLTDVNRLRNLGGIVAEKTNELYYSDGEELFVLNIESGEKKAVWKCPKGFSYSPISTLSDGSIVSFTLTEKVELKTKTEVLHSEANEKFNKKPLSIIMYGKRKNNQWSWSEVARLNKWINHTQLNPIDGKTILYSCEGPQKIVPQRLWLINSDGTNNHPVRIEENDSVHITHEFWFSDGIHIGYQNYIPKRKTIGIIDLRDNENFIEYILPEDNTHNFARFNKNNKLLVMGDGSTKSPYINFYTIDLDNKEIINTVYPIKVHPNRSQEYWHQHARFSSTGRYLVYASANEKKGGDIYIIDKIPE